MLEFCDELVEWTVSAYLDSLKLVPVVVCFPATVCLAVAPYPCKVTRSRVRSELA
jgi:hypothetical protein